MDQSLTAVRYGLRLLALVREIHANDLPASTFAMSPILGRSLQPWNQPQRPKYMALPVLHTLRAEAIS